jgi:hypothetical protein
MALTKTASVNGVKGNGVAGRCVRKKPSGISSLSSLHFVVRIDFTASKKPRPFPTGALDDCWFL